MKKLYEKNETYFALVWIGIYVVGMNIAMQFCNGFDDLQSKTSGQLLVPVVAMALIAIASTVWIFKNGLAEKYGFCRFKGNWKSFLWFIPLIVMSCTNLVNGLTMNASLLVSLLMMLNKAGAGYVEEVIFRGFLFRGMAKDNLKSAVIVSAVTFGAGHIVNLGNTADKLGVLLQVCYAIAVGFAYTVVVYKGGSLWPCIASHMFVNGSSVFAREQGAFTNLLSAIFGEATHDLEQTVSAVLLIVINGGYALWVWKKAENLKK